MKRILTLALFLCLALTAWASPTISVVFPSSGGTPYGTNGPYDLTLNGVTALVPCLTDGLSIGGNESWQAIEVPVMSLKSGAYVDFADPFTANNAGDPPVADSWTQSDLDEAVYLDTRFALFPGTTNSSAVTAIQEAIWDILGGTTPKFSETDMTTNTGVGYWMAQATKNSGSLTDSFLSNYSVLIPVTVTVANGVTTLSEVTSNSPQWFLVQTPEPSSIYMLLGGISLIGIGRIVRRKRAA